MNDTNDQTLVTTFPTIFRNLTYTECGNGWFNIIYNLCQRIIEIDPIGSVYAEQIKSKFGGLRFYYSVDKNGDRELYKKIGDLVREAEVLASKTCENCGTTENVSANNTGWVLTLCDGCRGEREQKKNE